MAQTIAVEARHAIKEFGQGPAAVRALNDVSISIREGEFFTLLGPSGCGKTTLLRLIAGFEMPTSGQILLSGQDITFLPPNRRPRCPWQCRGPVCPSASIWPPLSDMMKN